jgi:5'-phosphate synthase pdxT subunit
MNIGVLALQGGYQAHINCLNKLNVFCSLVRHRQTLAITDALIIPGGESSVLIRLLQENQLWNSLMDYDKPILGTCAGAILLAKQVFSPAQASLQRINISVTRNAYGRQLASRVVTGHCLVREQPMEMVFIRAPKISILENSSIKVLAHYQEDIVAVQENNIIAASFHPELSQDNYLHRYFIQQVGRSSA